MGRYIWRVSCPVGTWGLDLELRGREQSEWYRVPIETQGGASIPLIHDKWDNPWGGREVNVRVLSQGLGIELRKDAMERSSYSRP